MPRRLPDIIRSISAAINPDDVLGALHEAVAPLRVGAVFSLRSAADVVRFADILFHESVPSSARQAGYAIYAQYGLGQMTQLALLDPVPFTFSEAMSSLQPTGHDRDIFDLMQKHAIRDGLYCPHGSWMVVLCSDRVLKDESALTRDVRMTLHAAAGIAVYRLKEIMARRKLPEQPRLSPRELVVLRYLSHGEDAATIGRSLGLSETSVRTYLARAQKKLKAKSQQHAVATAMRNRLFDPRLDDLFIAEQHQAEPSDPLHASTIPLDARSASISMNVWAAKGQESAR